MHVSNLLPWLLPGLLGLVACWIILLNFSVVFLWCVRREHHSFIPLLGGCLAALAMLVSPPTGIARFAWIPLIVDLGCLYSFLGFLYAVVVLRCFSRRDR